MEQGVMSLLNLNLALATLVAFGIGLAVRGSWRSKLGLCFPVAIVGWCLRALAILNGDATNAEDYFNGLNFSTGGFELGVALAWTGLWCALGTVVARMMRRRKPEAH